MDWQGEIIYKSSFHKVLSAGKASAQRLALLAARAYQNASHKNYFIFSQPSRRPVHAVLARFHGYNKNDRKDNQDNEQGNPNWG